MFMHDLVCMYACLYSFLYGFGAQICTCAMCVEFMYDAGTSHLFKHTSARWAAHPHAHGKLSNTEISKVRGSANRSNRPPFEF